jgi:polyferredoxin
MTAVPPAPTPKPARTALDSLPRQDRHKPKCGPVRASRSSRKRAFVLIGVHVLIGLHFLHWGITGRSVTPVEPSEAMQTTELGRVNAGFLLFVALIAGTLVFGRWFCGWGCHVVALQDLCAWLLARIGLKPRPVRSRLLVLAPFAVAFHMFVWPHLVHWWEARPPRPAWHLELMTDDLWQTFPGWIMAPITLLVVGLLIVWWLGAKGFCTHGCPYGAFFALADRVAPMRIVVSPACDACGHCTSVCTSNVRVHEEVAVHGMIVDPGCMKCFDCVSVCPKEALRYGLAMPKPFAVSQQRRAARADFTWPEEIALAAVAFVAAQWTFRGAWFGEGVPLLLAVGLGVITAVFALLAVRLLRRRDVTFQHTELKRDGRLLAAGRWAAAGLALWLAFTAHTFVAQRWRSEALAAAVPPLSEFRANAPVDTARFAAAHAAVDAALAFDLVDDPTLLQMRGLLRRHLGRDAEAEADLRRGLQGPNVAIEAVLALAIYRGRQGDLAEAESLARRVLATDPENATAREILRRVGDQRGR